MCGRYTLTQPENIKKRFNTENDPKSADVSYNIAPSQYLPTITRNSPNRVIMMKWGLVPGWAKKNGFGMINLRDDTASQKPYFKNLLKEYRCLIPASGFYEWKKVKVDDSIEKIPYYIKIKGNELFSFAGVFNELKDAEGKKILTFAIVTTKPNSLIKDIHNRMPVILRKDEEDTWLASKTEFGKLKNMLSPFDATKMTAYKVSKLVNSPKNDNDN